MRMSAAPSSVALPLKGIRRTAARRLTAAWTAPVFHLQVSVDMTAPLAASKSVDGATVTDVLVSATAAALRAYPQVNATYADEVVTRYERVSVGIAVATDAGLVVPVVHEVDDLSLQEVASRRRDVVTRAREGALTMADVQGGTFTISNLGMLGIERFDAIVNAPQVAILAVGSTVIRPVVEAGEVVARPVAELTLTCDHRALDGAAGATFLVDLRGRLLAAGAAGSGAAPDDR